MPGTHVIVRRPKAFKLPLNLNEASQLKFTPEPSGRLHKKLGLFALANNF
jgi:hypothetical protein